eukprot:PhM_4_TR10890/c0_g1_i1/m.19569
MSFSFSITKKTLVGLLVLVILVTVVFTAPVDQERKQDAPKKFKNALPDRDDQEDRTTMRCDICVLTAEEIIALHKRAPIDFEDDLNEVCDSVHMDYGLRLSEERMPTSHYAKFGDTAKGSWINHFFKENCNEFITHNEDKIMQLKDEADGEGRAMMLEDLRLAMKCSDVCLGIVEDEIEDL